ncbi:Anaphase-Promoting Complex subunit 3 [Carpediemonas membranifera]|uniref:Anaphase-Promoting Complex subunit 3 n=1 Tax=Carpediemonas membranifera TaxID=201153 RepID=A0A8J6B994_9EUKA|nr:Anaphase-Promoting Complex subunit 3 [Carpediemonas membranifera]|eukprot:KAG9392637.1 Anaphase-Promoting Complex subunit 3 [Carpediemonas membranifera]
MSGDHSELLRCLEEAIRNRDYVTAEFIAQESLHLAKAQEKDPAVLRVALAEVFLQLRRWKVVTQCLYLEDSERGQYLKAQAHFELSEYVEARRTLLHTIRKTVPNIDEADVSRIAIDAVPNGAYGWGLLGECLARGGFQEPSRNAVSQAAKCFENALSLNPLMYSALDGLVRLGRVPAGYKLDTTVQSTPYSLTSPSASNELRPRMVAEVSDIRTPQLQVTPAERADAEEGDSFLQTPELNGATSTPAPAPSDRIEMPPPRGMAWRSGVSSVGSAAADSLLMPAPTTVPVPRLRDERPTAEHWVREDAGVEGVPPVSGLVKSMNVAWTLFDLFAKGDFSRALSRFIDLPQPIISSPFVLRLAGQAYFSCGRYFDCEAAYSRLRKAVPYASNLIPYCEALWALDRKDQLNALSHELLTRDAGDIDGLVAVALSCSLDNNNTGAIEGLQKSIRKQPANAALWRLLGQEKIDQNNINEAQKDLHKAITLDSRDFGAWVGLGNVYMKAGEHTDAIRCYRQALGLNQSSAAILSHLGIAYSMTGDKSSATSALEHAAGIDPENPTALFHLARLEAENPDKTDIAISRLKFVVLRQKSVNAHVLLGQLFLRQGRVMEAFKEAEVAMVLDKRSRAAQALYDAISEA